MTLKNLGDSIFINMAEPYYGFSNWASRKQLIDFLREASKQIKRAIDTLGGNTLDMPEYHIDELNGAVFALEWAADALENFRDPIQKIRCNIQDQINILDSKLQTIRQAIGFEKDFLYYGTQMKVLMKLFENTAEMQDEENELLDNMQNEKRGV